MAKLQLTTAECKLILSRLHSYDDPALIAYIKERQADYIDTLMGLPTMDQLSKQGGEGIECLLENRAPYIIYWSYQEPFRVYESIEDSDSDETTFECETYDQLQTWWNNHK